MNYMGLPAIDKTWTLFIDRDGVINVEKAMDYVRNWDEFRFYPGVKEGLALLNQVFGHIFVVTNQKGVGKGLMTEDNLLDIHSHMLEEINGAGGHIDKVYYAIALEDDHPMRKPNPGMGLRAAKEFGDVRFARSFMIGNTFSDMEFGRKIGARTIFLPTTREAPPMPHPLVDYLFGDLLSAARALATAAGLVVAAF